MLKHDTVKIYFFVGLVFCPVCFQEYFPHMMTASIMVGGNRSVGEGNRSVGEGNPGQPSTGCCKTLQRIEFY